MAKTKQTSVGTYNPKPKSKGKYKKKLNKSEKLSTKPYVGQGR
jgi:hypothetical protein